MLCPGQELDSRPPRFRLLGADCHPGRVDGDPLHRRWQLVHQVDLLHRQQLTDPLNRDFGFSPDYRSKQPCREVDAAT